MALCAEAGGRRLEKTHVNRWLWSHVHAIYWQTAQKNKKKLQFRTLKYRIIVQQQQRICWHFDSTKWPHSEPVAFAWGSEVMSSCWDVGEHCSKMKAVAMIFIARWVVPTALSGLFGSGFWIVCWNCYTVCFHSFSSNSPLPSLDVPPPKNTIYVTLLLRSRRRKQTL